MMKNKYKDFLIGDIFSIKSTSSSIDKNKLTGSKGVIPYVTRSDLNNGIDMFIGTQNVKYQLDSSNVITIGLDTQTVFYQPSKFYTGQNIQVLSFDSLNSYTALYASSLLKVQMLKFNWGGNGATLGRLNKTKIMLPVNSDQKPDYDYMESYIKDLQDQKEKEYFEYISKRFKDLKDVQEPVKLEDKDWYDFKVVDIFMDVQRGKRLKKGDHIEGGIPYASSTGVNNGIDGFIGNTSNVRCFNNCLTIANSGSVGATFYHPYKFIASDHVTQLGNKELSRYSYLFIASMMERLSSKYGFNREINDKRLKKEKIMLPMNNQKQPDYEYMENYMKYLEYQKLKAYLDFKGISL